MFISEFKFEEYLKKNSPKLLKFMIKFRTRNHKMPVETGPWNSIDYKLRLCNSCNNCIGDAFHYLFECQHFMLKRRHFLKTEFYTRPNVYTFNRLMNINKNVLVEYKKLCLFVKEIISQFM